MLKINVADLEELKVVLLKGADDTIESNTSGAFGIVEAAAEKAIVHATIDGVIAYLEQTQTATTHP